MLDGEFAAGLFCDEPAPEDLRNCLTHSECCVVFDLKPNSTHFLRAISVSCDHAAQESIAINAMATDLKRYVFINYKVLASRKPMSGLRLTGGSPARTAGRWPEEKLRQEPPRKT